MDDVVTSLTSIFLIGSSLFFHLTRRTLIKDWDEFEILQDPTKDL